MVALTEMEIRELWDAYLTPAKPPTFTQLAKQFSRDRETVSKHLKSEAFEQYRDDVQEQRKRRALEILTRGSEEAAEAWIDAAHNAAERGDHRPAKELLIATGTIADKAVETHGGVTVIVGMPGKTDYADPFIAVSSGMPRVPALTTSFSPDSPSKELVNVLTIGAAE